MDRGRINTSSAGTLALTTNTYTNNISMGNYSSLSIGANGNCDFSGTMSTNGSAYRLGGGGGTLTVSTQNALSGAKQLSVNGNVNITNSNNYSGATTVNSGTLTLGGSGSISSSSSITLMSSGTLLQNSSTELNRTLTFSGGTLGGQGQYTGNINMGSSSGHLSPGATGVGSIGTLTIGGTGNVTLGSTSVLDFDFGTTSGSCDLLAMTGTSRTLVLNGTLNITNSGGVARGDYTIISGFSNYSGSLSFGSLPAGHNWSMAITDVGSYHNLVITAAPEPGTIVLLATGLLGLLAYAWRKRR
jgi:autotransporter-associated beta strand protein